MRRVLKIAHKNDEAGRLTPALHHKTYTRNNEAASHLFWSAWRVCHCAMPARSVACTAHDSRYAALRAPIFAIVGRCLRHSVACS
jgi:hypothetical protein